MSETPLASRSLAAAVASLDARPVPGVAEAVEAPAPERRSGTRFVWVTGAATSYAVSEAFVAELERVPRVTLVPQTPEWLRGVTNRRGEILSVVDLRTYLGLGATPAATGRMLVLRLPGEDFS